jgi:glutathione peroxidase
MYAAIRVCALLAVMVTAPLGAGAACPPLLDTRMETLMHGEASLCQFSGKVLLVVNTASQCGYTPQYQGLEKLYRRYKDRGLVVLGFPSNDFGDQEPGGAREIAQFCEINYGVSFPMFAKTRVVSEGGNPFYDRLAHTAARRPQWNFHKYLVDRRGEKVLAFPSNVAPEDRRLVTEIERLLAQP